MTLCFRVVVGGLILVGLSAFGGAESAAPTAAQPPPVTTSATERALTTTDAVPTTTEKAASKKPCSYPGQEIVYRGRKRCLSEERRMLIYYDLVREQDEGDDIAAFAIVAKRFHIPYRVVRYDIPIEGSSNNWPTPPPP
jgi:hypothetical protein